MNYKILGRTGVKVSEICYGTMAFGGDADEVTSERMYRRIRELGINFFDTANVYSRGRSEEILGKLIKGERDELVITSKVCGAMGDGVNDRGLSRRHIVQQVEASLKRLQTDRLELYFVHNFDDDTPIEETLSALDDLVQAGKILYPAVSNWAAWQIAKALGHCAREGLARFECIQPMYNLAKRQVEVEILPLAQSEGLGVISYSPLGGGLLTGKYGVDKRPTGGRLLQQDNYIKRYAKPVHYEVADNFVQGRIALAGDSAHVNNPLGGMGMNGGIHDGINISEKLVRIWRNEGDHTDLFPQYDRQRRTMAKKYVQAQSIANKEILQENNMDVRRGKLDALGEIADDKVRCHEYLLKSSLIAMVREANATA